MARRFATVLLPLPLVILGVATIVFIALRVIPGDAVNTLASQGGVSEEQRMEIREELGLGDPLYTQYAIFVGSLLRLDFGESFYSGTSVGGQIGDALPVTIELTIASVLIMLVVGVVGGIIAAAARGTWLDASLRGVATTLFSIPWFSLGIVLILIFSVELGWLPTFGRMPPTANYQPDTNFVLIDAVIQGRPDLIWPWIQHLILPAVCVGLTTAGFVLRITRASFLEVDQREFVTTARAKGMSERRVLTHHMARNASIPIVTIIGLLVGTLLGGAVVTEVVFAYPGIGQLLVQSILQRDFPVAQGAAIVIALTYVIVNTLTDLSYVVLDPRARSRRADG
jgi:peptide/nickel transport system permease protein